MASCSTYPRDIDGTLDRIEQSHVVRVGLAELRPGQQAKAQQFIARIEHVTGARATIDMAPAEAQLARLEEGGLDLVIGEFADDTPWIETVAVLEPLDHRAVGHHQFGLAPAAANGENCWIGLLEHEIRSATASPRS
ncbi:MAG: hypothetical protein ABIT16_11655 [Croceibacterium sp.]